MKKIPSKIKNLLKAKKYGFNVPNFIFVNTEEIKKNRHKILNKINLKFKKNKKVIIRSSAYDEDNNISNAGKYSSFIIENNEDQIIKKIFEVSSKYKKKLGFVIVQEYINDSHINGVIFTRDPVSQTNYFTINFYQGRSTNKITSGSITGEYFVFFSKLGTKNIKNIYLKKLINTSKKICKKFKNDNLDIEFSVNKKKIVKIFQIRKLHTRKKFNLNPKVLFDLEKKIKKMIHDRSILYGNHTIYSNMTDWNPAEIIGVKPKTLSSSLYKELIANEIWSESRRQLGYSNCYNLPLIHEFMGSPYVDVRLTLNSFIPAGLDSSLKLKLINYYLKKFKSNPSYFYDKIESKVIFSCNDFSLNKNIKILKKYKFTDKEIITLKKSLNKVTNKIFNSLNDNIRISSKLINKTKKIQNKKIHSINKIFNLINLCKIYGTLPFANLARMAFIDIQFLNSMVKNKIITDEDKNIFLNSINSITSKMNNDLIKKNKIKFLQKYGHLRPNTYEINSKNYKENFNAYFNNFNNLKIIRHKKYNFNNKQKLLIKKFLKKNSISKDLKSFLNFIKLSIIHREQSKFNFTYCLNAIFEELKKVAIKSKIKRNDSSFIDIDVIKKLYNNFTYEFVKKTLHDNIKSNKKNYFFNQNFKLPNIILNQKDVVMFTEKKYIPTFVSKKNVFGETVYINELINHKNLNNKIVFIKNADPGYDYIFTKKIRGLVTAYGGPNSHMFIRCNEMGIPAVIGVGDKNFNKLKNSRKVFLNCLQKDISSL